MLGFSQRRYFLTFVSEGATPALCGGNADDRCERVLCYCPLACTLSGVIHGIHGMGEQLQRDRFRNLIQLCHEEITHKRQRMETAAVLQAYHQTFTSCKKIQMSWTGKSGKKGGGLVYL